MDKLFHVYKSSAGSGKTYTLVKEYLKIVLLEPGKVRHILAITFTNAAAAEMKARIIEALAHIGGLAVNPESKKGRALLMQIMEDLKTEPDRAIPSEGILIGNAQRVLKQILHQYTDFSVSTIDSFVHRVIRTFAFDLRIPFNFEVELDADSLLSQAVDMLINRAGSDKKLTELLVTYMMNQADDEQDVRIEQKIARMARTLTEEDSIIHIERLRDIPPEAFQRLAGRLRKSVRGFEHSIQKEAKAAMDLIHAQNIPPTAFYRGSQGIISYFKHLAAGNVREKIHPGRYVLDTIDEDRWFSGRSTAEQQAGIQNIKPLLEQHYETIQSIARNKLQRYFCEQALLKTIFPLALLNEVEKMTEEIKTENVLLHISDFNKYIAAIVSRQPVPFIYERLGERYRHYMIDEFQDTSLLQWQNLLPLVENSLSEGQMSLVVGDGKQAIYRFRNGDVEQFASLPRLTEGIRAMARPEWEATLHNNYNEKNLDTNWRSAKAIVDFNNRFFLFAKNALTEKLQNIYKDVSQKVLPGKPEGFVSIAFLEGQDQQSLAEQNLQQVVEIIDKCLTAGHPLSDITVLCRANNEASMVARELLTHQIPVISAESLLLNQSDEVNLFLAILKLLANPHESIAAVEMLTFLHKNKKITNPASLHETFVAAGLYKTPANDGSGSLHASLERIMQQNTIDFSFRDFVHLNIYDTCETILRIFFADQSPPNPFVAFFMDAVYDFSEKHMLSYADFISWWEENGDKYSIVVPEGVEAVQVMTVHKSKGLQFPVVIHPFARQKPDKLTKSGLWTDGEKTGITDLPAQWLEMSQSSLSGTPFEQDLAWEQQKTFLDMLNATYVALTRPSQKLFVLSKKEPNKYNPHTVNGLLYHFLEHEGLWQGDKNLYTFGLFEPPVEKKPAGEIPGQPMQRLLSNPWSRALRMKSHQRERSLLLDSQDPLERGSLLHRAMENITHVNDIEPVLGQMKNNGEIDNKKMAEWTEKIRQIIKDPEVAPYFLPGNKIKTEAGLFDQDGAFYRPDRVVFLKNECVIIDYKTGKQYQKHAAQMNTYAGILKRMGTPVVKKVLLYLDEGTVKTV